MKSKWDEDDDLEWEEAPTAGMDLYLLNLKFEKI